MKKSKADKSNISSIETKRFRTVWVVAAILWTLFIWSNSMQTAGESSQVSRGVLDWLVPLLAQTGLPEELWHTLVRKLAHMTEFAVLGVLVSDARTQRGEIPARKRLWHCGCSLLLCFVVAAADEFIQLFVPGRSGELRDVCIDLFGGMMGILAVALIRHMGTGCRKR